MKIKQLFNEYLEFGGFPKVVLSNDKDIKKDTLMLIYSKRAITSCSFKIFPLDLTSPSITIAGVLITP